MDASLRSALLLSLAVHAGLLFGLPRLRALPPAPVLTPFEVTVRSTSTAPPPLKLAPPLPPAPRAPDPLAASQHSAAQPAAADLTSAAAGQPGGQAFGRAGAGAGPALSAPAIQPGVKPMTTTMPADKPVFSDVIDLTNLSQYVSEAPGSLSYYAAVRKRIEYFAFRNGVATDRPLHGRIYLTFALLSSGHVKDIRLDQARSDPDPFLQQLTIRSVQDAAPFPPFPETVLAPQRTFTILVEYQLTSPAR